MCRRLRVWVGFASICSPQSTQSLLRKIFADLCALAISAVNLFTALEQKGAFPVWLAGRELGVLRHGGHEGPPTTGGASKTASPCGIYPGPQLQIVNFPVQPAFGNSASCVRAERCPPSAPNGSARFVKALGDDKRGAALHEFRQRLLDQKFGCVSTLEVESSRMRMRGFMQGRAMAMRWRWRRRA